MGVEDLMNRHETRTLNTQTQNDNLWIIRNAFPFGDWTHKTQWERHIYRPYVFVICKNVNEMIILYFILHEYNIHNDNIIFMKNEKCKNVYQPQQPVYHDTGRSA